MNNKTVFTYFAAAVALAQQPADPLATRQIWDTSFLEKRPPGAGKAAAVKPLPKIGAVKGALVGVTLWNMRPSKAEDTREIRALIHEEDGSDVELTPERLPSDSPLKERQKIRISVESGEAGYLYIIDRDFYADGTKSDAYLIFPTKKLRNGDAFVRPGLVVEIPEPGNKTPYFKIERSRQDQVNETLTILVSPKPIPELHIADKRQKLTDAQVAEWEKKWQAKTLKLEAKGQEGKPYTVTEKQAASGGKPLTSADPVPQTMYQVENKPGEPVLLHVPLRIVK